MNGEYGLKIKNFSCGSIYEVWLGVRDNYDTKDAMLTNSLFLDFLKTKGLNIWKEESTRDIICIEFNYGSRSYDAEKKRINKYIKDLSKNTGISAEERNRKYNFYQKLLEETEKKKSKFEKKSKQELRTLFYKEGCWITYKTHNKSGEVISEEKIHYLMLYRTTGKAKVGSCMFIREELYKDARDFLYMGLKLPEKNAPIVEVGAYSSLITSNIVGRIKIEPENILILKDYDSFFTTNVVSIETNENRECQAIERDNYQLKNTMFDGQALIDSSIFPSWADGYILLRHHFCKMAAFCTHIQNFFMDYYGDDYNTATITDMFGNKHKVTDIKLITTDNACKFLKFNVSYEYWCEKVHENGCMFGIVKTAHKSKLGQYQKMSYQMVNALDLSSMPDVMRETSNYIVSLKLEEDKFNDYLRKNANFSNDYEVLLDLCKWNPQFTRSSYFRERKTIIIANYMLGVKSGKVIQNADNLVIVGSPYAMLLYTVGEDPESDPTFDHEDGAIQCYTGRFADGEYLAGFRSPMNGMQNIACLHNHYHEYFTKYFDLGTQIIAANMTHTDFQDRCNGSDQDLLDIWVC